MLHPSYTDLMKVVNSNVEIGEEPVVNSRYSIVIATAKRARQLIDGDEPLVEGAAGKKPFSIAVDELYKGQVKILAEEEAEKDSEEASAQDITEEIEAEDVEEFIGFDEFDDIDAAEGSDESGE